MFIYSKNIFHHYNYKKNNRELETIVQECIVMAIRESIPTESKLKKIILVMYYSES